MSEQPLHIKYRPESFDEVIGNASAVSSIEDIIERRTSHCFLFTGPSGCGKTTLARITAKEFGAAGRDILEIDAATHTGVDNMRQVAESLSHRPFGEGKAKAVILDECHMLSKASWNSILKAMEDTPDHAYWFLCTTEGGRVPETIKNRCSVINLGYAKEDELGEIIDAILEAEEKELKDSVVDVIVSEAHGSPRRAIQNLNMCWNASTKKEAADALKAAVEGEPIRELCKILLNGGSWPGIMAVLSKLEDENPESVRIIVVNYMAAVLRNTKTDNKAQRPLHVLEQFSEPFNQSEKQAPLMLAIGRVLYSE